jgi:hypothetical protein
MRQLKVLLILFQKPLTIGVAVAIVFGVIVYAVMWIAYICSQINDAMPDPSTSTGTQVASGARTGSPAQRLCTGLQGG